MPITSTIRELEAQIVALKTANKTFECERVAQQQLIDELRDSETKFAHAFNCNAAILSISTLKEGRYVEVNDAFCQTTGYTRAEVIGKTSRDLNLWESSRQRDQLVAVLQRDGTVRNWEISIQDRHGNQHEGIFSADLITLCGKPHLLVSVNDITERKHAEEALRQSEDKFARAFNSNTSLMGISTMQEGRYIEVNDEFCRVLGYTRGEVIGKTSQELNLWGDIHERDRIIAVLQRDGTVRNREVELRTKHGDRHIGLFSAELISMQGAPHVLTTVNDITDRKRAERLVHIQRDLAVALSETSHLEAGARLCVNAAIDAAGMDSGGVYILSDATGNLDLITHTGFQQPAFVEMVRHAVAGTPNHALAMAGKPIYSQYLLEAHPMNPIRLSEGLQALALIPLQHEGQVIGSLNIASHTSPEVPTYARESLETIAAQIGNALARLTAEHEIRRLNAELETRVMQRTAELEAANRELKDFAHIVSHDLKAPLRGISRLGQWLVEDYAAAFDDEGKNMVAMLIQRVKGMDSLIDGILEYSRVGRVVHESIPVDLNRLIPEVLEQIAAPPHIHVVIETPLPTVLGDKIRLFQVFQNLFSNAIRFMDKPAGQITIGCVDEDTQWRLSVKDNGPGIDPRHHERIFQIFQTIHARAELESTGVGLAIVKKIVEFYGGQVGVESTAGSGSTFWLTWPKNR